MSDVRWLAEALGVLTLAVAASLVWLPLGIAVTGVYLVIWAQMRSHPPGGK